MMRTRFLNLALLICLAGVTCRGESLEQPSIFGRLERDLARDSADGTINRYSIIEAALVSSGDHLVVTHGTAGLNHRRHPGLRRLQKTVRKGEEGI